MRFAQSQAQGWKGSVCPSIVSIAKLQHCLSLTPESVGKVKPKTSPPLTCLLYFAVYFILWAFQTHGCITIFHLLTGTWGNWLALITNSYEPLPTNYDHSMQRHSKILMIAVLSGQNGGWCQSFFFLHASLLLLKYTWHMVINNYWSIRFVYMPRYHSEQPYQWVWKAKHCCSFSLTWNAVQQGNCSGLWEWNICILKTGSSYTCLYYH